MRRLRDEQTRAPFDVLTGGVGNNRHVYFNRANFTHDGRQVIFLSDRTGSWQVFSYDIAGQRLRRLTDAALDPGRPSIDPCRPLLYYTQGDSVRRLHVQSLEDTVIYTHSTPSSSAFGS